MNLLPRLWTTSQELPWDPLRAMRRLGFRTSYEIEEERQALKALRGDFKLEGAPDRATAALDAARA